MWRDLLIIDHLISPVSEDILRTREHDKLVLTWEQRRWVRGRFTTDKGRKIGLALPTGTTLPPETILWIEADWYLRVEAAAEPVLEIFPADRDEAIKIAFEVGNRHFPLAIEGNTLQVPDDKAMIRLMDRLGAKWTRRQTVFNPIGNTESHQHA
jgi:urease accessory protein